MYQPIPFRLSLISGGSRKEKFFSRLIQLVFITGNTPFPYVKLKISDRKFEISVRNFSDHGGKLRISDRNPGFSVRIFDSPYLMSYTSRQGNYFSNRENRRNCTGIHGYPGGCR